MEARDTNDAESHESEIVEVLQATSSPVRISILELLEKGPLRYNDLMRKLGLDQKTDAGKFSFHVKKLMRTRLIEIDEEEKKYKLTRRGESVLKKIYEMQEESIESEERPLVRTSRLKFERFETRKIVESLVKETGMDEDEANEIALEVSERINRLKIKYLTAPLVRELVINALLERGEERLRHKITRLGLPVYDVKEKLLSIPSVEAAFLEAGKEVFRQYSFLEVLPRKIGDMHMEETVTIKFLESWSLRPLEVIHLLNEDAKWSALISGSHLKNSKANKEEKDIILGEFSYFLSKEVDGYQTILLTNDTLNYITNLGKVVLLSLQNGIKLNLCIDFKEVGKDNLTKVFDNIVALSKTMLTNDLRITVFNIEKAEEALSLTESAVKIASLGCQIKITKQNAISLYSNVQVKNISNKDELHGKVVLGEINVNLLNIWSQSKGKEALFFDKLRATMNKISEAFKIKDKFLQERLENKLLPILSSVGANGRTFFNDKEFLGIVSFKNIRSSAKEMSGGESQRGYEGMLEKIVNSIRAATLRGASDKIKLLIAPMINDYINLEEKFPLIGLESSLPVSEQFSAMKEDLSLQSRLIGTTFLGLNVDHVENKLIREIATNEEVENLVLFTKRKLCSNCGEIISAESTICPYCGAGA
ncbi:MAG: anaerobic ribonucleoside-triphosphate reductase [Thermoproteota archaeon]